MKAAVDAAVARIGLWVGPEAGFAPDEVALFPEDCRIALGQNILRAETAGVFGVGLLVHLTRGAM
ncbi:MAG: 16S rRNA (uracil(1498)-N(3))-methyltransferase [bacterium]